MPELVPFAVDRADITPYYEALDAALAGTGPALAPYEAGTPAPDVPRHPTDAPQRLALVVSTSGSTGTPKRAMLTKDALIASATATHERIGAGTWLLPLPPHHIAGTQVIVRSLIAGTTPIVMDAWSLEQFTRATTLVARNAPPFSPIHTSLVPTQLRDVLDAAERDDPVGVRALEAARRYRSILVGGAATPPDLQSRASDAGLSIVTTYGSSETAGGCVYDGVPLAGVGVHVLDADDEGLGRIALSGPTLASGYLGDAERSAATFVAARILARPTIDSSPVDSAPDGDASRESAPTGLSERRRSEATPGEATLFLTDDLGRFDGALHIEGRIDDVINTGGYKVSPRVVEDVVRGVDGIRDAVVVARPHERWGQCVAVAVVTTERREATDDVLARLMGECRKALPPYAVPAMARVLETIPLTGVGKPDRALIACSPEWHNLRDPR